LTPDESKDYVKSEVPVLNAEEWLDYLDNEEAGEEIPAPLGIIPFLKGTVTAFGAETGVGKTAYGLQAARWVCEAGHSAAIITLEMSPGLLFQRFAPQFDSIEGAKDWIKTYHLHVSRSYLDFKEVELILQQGDFEFVVIDHIHEIPFDGHEDLAKKVKRIGALATETNTAVLMLAQVKQPDPMMPNAEPGMYDFSWTKAIPEVAGRAQILWRPDPGFSNLELRMVKNRFGPIQNAIPLSLDVKTVSFNLGR